MSLSDGRYAQWPSGQRCKAANSPLGLVFSGEMKWGRMIRDDIKAALVGAMKGGDKAATGDAPPDPVGDQEPRHRVAHRGAPPDDDALVTEVLQKMIKQRRESVEIYRKGGREELRRGRRSRNRGHRALPARADGRRGGQRRDPGDHRRDRRRSMKDMGRVMAQVKERLGASIEPARASALVKARSGLGTKKGPAARAAEPKRR